MTTKSITIAIVGIALNLLISETASSSQTYQVTITNLTAGQPLTPPVLLTHTKRISIFGVGEPASEEIQAIAENGDPAPLLAALGSNAQVHEVVAGMAPIVPANDPGGTGFESSLSFMITAQGSAKFLSFVSMLICTNDGFTGLSGVQLPKRKLTLFSAGYDARTETNTEDFANMVPPCQDLIGVMSDDEGTGMTDPTLAEDGVVIPHVGILGGADLLPAVHGWTDPVVKIEIERVSH